MLLLAVLLTALAQAGTGALTGVVRDPDGAIVRGARISIIAIDTGLTRDLYVSLGEPVGDGAWGVRIYYKPFVDWIWAGCVLMALGGVLAASDRRYRLAARRASVVPQAAGAAA